jgi:hypothetical protein
MALGCVPAHTDTIRTLAYTGISGTYAAVGSALTHNTRMLRLVNLTQGNVMFSDDGTNDKWIVPAGSFVLYDYTSNSHPVEGSMAYAKAIQIYVKQITSPTSGAVYIECTYAQGQ